jgi:hypothetical protein
MHIVCNGKTILTLYLQNVQYYNKNRNISFKENIQYNLVYGLKTVKRYMKRVNCSKQGYTSITCSKIEYIPYNLIFTTANLRF